MSDETISTKTSDATEGKFFFTRNSTAELAIVDKIFASVDLIPNEKKAAFSKATKECPQLVNTESDPMRFFRHCNEDHQAAAQSIVVYWEEREKLFGSRAYLPMVQTGNGALSAEDIMTLHTGKVALLRRTKKGEEVIFVDRSRVLPSSTTNSKLRSVFYMLSEVSKRDLAQSKGCRVMNLLVTPRNADLDVPFVRGFVKILNYMPVKTYLHMMICLPKLGMTPAIQRVVTTGVSHGMTHVNGLKVHSKPVGPPILKELQAVLGLSPSDLPASIGGSWMYERHVLWCRERGAEERDCEEEVCRPPGGTTKNSSEKKRKRTQSLNVIHSRLKRERRKAEEKDLHGVYDKLAKENAELEKERKRLERLLSEAQGLASLVESSKGSHGSSPTYAGATLQPSAPSPLPNFSQPPPPLGPGPASAPMTQNLLQGLSHGRQPSLDLILNQCPDVQRTILAALQSQTREQDYKRARAAEVASLLEGLRALLSPPSPLHYRPTQLPPQVPNPTQIPTNARAVLEIFSLLSSTAHA